MKSYSPELELLGKAIDLRAQRQQVLASNIANADTPHYKARDFDFREAMQRAMANQLAMNTTSAKHLEGQSGANMLTELKYRKEIQSAVDGNTVDMDTERSQMAENSIQYQILTSLISDEFKDMKLAVSSNGG